MAIAKKITLWCSWVVIILKYEVKEKIGFLHFYFVIKGLLTPSHNNLGRTSNRKIQEK